MAYYGTLSDKTLKKIDVTKWEGKPGYVEKYTGENTIFSGKPGRSAAHAKKRAETKAESDLHRGVKTGGGAHERYKWIMDKMRTDGEREKLRKLSSDDILESVDRIADKGKFVTKYQIDKALEEIRDSWKNDPRDINDVMPF